MLNITENVFFMSLCHLKNALFLQQYRRGNQSEMMHTWGVLCSFWLNKSFIAVQIFPARTTKHPLNVRPYLLTPYVQRPFERTTKQSLVVRPGKIASWIRGIYVQEPLFFGL